MARIWRALLLCSNSAIVRPPYEHGSIRFRAPIDSRNLLGKWESPKLIVRLNVIHIQNLIFEAAGHHIADADVQPLIVIRIEIAALIFRGRGGLIGCMQSDKIAAVQFDVWAFQFPRLSDIVCGHVDLSDGPVYGSLLREFSVKRTLIIKPASPKSAKVVKDLSCF